MASLSNQNGRRVLQWNRGDKRYTLGLGRISKKDAEIVRAHVETILASNMSGTPIPPDTAAWLGRIGQSLHDGLSSRGVIGFKRGVERVTIEAHCERFINGIAKPRTKENFKQVKRALKAFFGAKFLDQITKGDARDFLKWMLSGRGEESPLAPATAAGWMRKARQVFNDAIEHGLLTVNPFDRIKLPGMANDARNIYVTASDVMKLIDHCPENEWKLLFAFARFAGVRIPSEVQGMLWDDINWSLETIRIYSPKTAHHPGKESRVIPIFAAILPYLLAAHCAAPYGATKVFRKLRWANPGTQAKRLIKGAGLPGWGKPFQNLRASCETDFATALPLHVACALVGNTEKVAMKHYVSVTPEHMSAAKALHSTVDRDGQGQTQATKTPVETREGGNQYPRQGYNIPAIPPEKQQELHEALQQALHPKQKQARRLLGRMAHRLGLHSQADEGRGL